MAFAKAVRESGLTWEEIAKKLDEQGFYRQTRTLKAYAKGQRNPGEYALAAALAIITGGDYYSFIRPRNHDPKP